MWSLPSFCSFIHMNPWIVQAKGRDMCVNGSLCFSFSKLPCDTCSHKNQKIPNHQVSQMPRVRHFVPSLFREWTAKETSVQRSNGFFLGQFSICHVVRASRGYFYGRQRILVEGAAVASCSGNSVQCSGIMAMAYFVKCIQFRNGERFLTSLSRHISCFPCKTISSPTGFWKNVYHNCSLVCG